MVYSFATIDAQIKGAPIPTPLLTRSKNQIEKGVNSHQNPPPPTLISQITMARKTPTRSCHRAEARQASPSCRSGPRPFPHLHRIVDIGSNGRPLISSSPHSTGTPSSMPSESPSVSAQTSSMTSKNPSISGQSSTKMYVPPKFRWN